MTGKILYLVVPIACFFLGQQFAEPPRISIHEAAICGHVPLIKSVLANGTRVNIMNDEGDTPLHFAAFDGSVDAIKILLGAGAKADRKNNLGMTPIHVAASKANVKAVKALLDSGGALSKKEMDSLTLFTLEFMSKSKDPLNSYLEIIKTIEAHSAQ